GQRARVDRARHRRREHGGEGPSGEDTSDRGGLLAAPRRERDVGVARVLARLGPVGVAVADEPELARPVAVAHGALTASGRARTRPSGAVRRPPPGPTSSARRGGGAPRPAGPRAPPPPP